MDDDCNHSGTVLAPCVAYNVADQTTGITFGSGDSDAYQYDANTGRITQFKFNMGTGPQSQTGALTWNANGTVQKLQITDQINSANSQTCKFGDPTNSIPGYDDLGRLIKADCASAWSQTFAFDPFGNLSKSGSALSTYRPSTAFDRIAPWLVVAVLLWLSFVLMRFAKRNLR